MSENVPESADKKDAGLLVVQSKIRELVKAKDKRVSDGFITALSEHVAATIDKAVARCVANGRSTLRPEDI